MSEFNFNTLNETQQRLLKEANWDEVKSADGENLHVTTFNGRDGDAIESIPKAAKTGDGVTVALTDSDKQKIHGRTYCEGGKSSITGATASKENAVS